jgi:hypothetical protein
MQDIDGQWRNSFEHRGKLWAPACMSKDDKVKVFQQILHFLGVVPTPVATRTIGDPFQ